MPDLTHPTESPKGGIEEQTLFKGKSTFRWLPPALWYGVIFWFSSRTQSELPVNIPDFPPHFVEFLILGFLVARAFRPKTSSHAAVVFMVLILLALGDECHQLFVPTRIFSLSDILADGLGALAGMGVWVMSASAKNPGLPGA